MKRIHKISGILTAWLLASGVTSAWASDAETSATAGGNTRAPNGNTAATAHYEGDRGFARTDTQSGRVNLARGVAVGFDEDGLSLSVSQAVATQYGPAVATTFNMSIDRDGDVSTSGGLTVSNGPDQRSATAGGSTGNGRAATAVASGASDPRGQAQAQTWAQQTPSRVSPAQSARIGGLPWTDTGRAAHDGRVVKDGRVLAINRAAGSGPIIGDGHREVRLVRR